MTDLTPVQIETWIDWARRDDWHTKFVGSDIRKMLAEIKNLRRQEKHLNDLIDGYKNLLK